MINVHHALLSTVSPSIAVTESSVSDHDSCQTYPRPPTVEPARAATRSGVVMPTPPETSGQKAPLPESSVQASERTEKAGLKARNPVSVVGNPSLPERQAARKTATMDRRRSRMTFEDFACQIRAHRYQIERSLVMRERHNSLQTSVGIFARLLRTNRRAHQFLVECLRHGDKPAFVDVWRSISDLNESCSTVGTMEASAGKEPRRTLGRPQTTTLDRRKTFSHLSSNSKNTVLEILHLIRTDGKFLASRFRQMSPAQIAALVSFPRYLDRNHPMLPVSAKTSSYSSAFRTNSRFSNSVKDRLASLERFSALSALLLNTFSPCSRSDSREARLRVRTWSTVCAELYCHSEHSYQTLVNHILSTFAALYQWRAMPRVELFLMDLLQRGAFLLETKEDSLHQAGNGAGRLDSLNTDAAEDFFENAVQNLLEILNDPDGGLPLGALEIGSAILGKLPNPDKQSRFRGLIFFQWFFCDYLPNVIVYPENAEAMLNYSISKEAREKILSQVAIRLQSQISTILSPTTDRSTICPSTMAHVEQMVSKLVETPPSTYLESTNSPMESHRSSSRSCAEFLLLSMDDVASVLDCCFPKAVLNTTSWDTYMTSGSSAYMSLQNTLFSKGHREEAPIPRADLQAQDRLSTPLRQALRQPESKFPDTTTLSKDLLRNIDRLRRELVEHSESVTLLGIRSNDTEWAVFPLGLEGKPCIPVWPNSHRSPGSASVDDISAATLNFDLEGDWSLVQQAALRLVEEERPLTSSVSSSLGPGKLANVSLETLIQEKIDYCRGRADAVQAHFWWRALSYLRENHPVCLLANDDTQILLPMVSRYKSKATQAEANCRSFEEDYGWLKLCWNELRDAVDKLLQSQSKLRDKMWFLSDVRHSNEYENAKGVAIALKNMVMPSEIGQDKVEGSLRGRLRVRAFTSSLFSHSEDQAMNVMKAAKEHGGPKKLSDEQIDITQKWLKRTGVENFCKGEERIHRFCLEVKTTVNKLVGDNFTNGPVLWSSDLYTKERTRLNAASSPPQAARPTSRPSSIVSEDGYPPSSYVSQNPRIDNFSRLQMHDNPSSPSRKFSFPGFSPERWRNNRESIISEMSSIGDSPGRATVSSATDSINSIWSPVFSNPHSTFTTATTMSRPASIYNIEGSIKQNPDQKPSEDKASFLNQVRNNLVALLLSDLSSPTWSCGSETDAWLLTVLEQKRMQKKLYKRANLERLLSQTESVGSASRAPAKTQTRRQLRQKRSLSAGEILGSQESVRGRRESFEDDLHSSEDVTSFSYYDGFAGLLSKFSRCAGPQDKLAVLVELRELALSSLNTPKPGSTTAERRAVSRTESEIGLTSGVLRNSRRQSLTPPSKPGKSTGNGSTTERNFGSLHPTEKDIVAELKRILVREQPKTLFRDLQFISAFVPPDILNNINTSGTAFLQFSLAALSFKDDVCQAMVEIADQTVAEHLRQPTSTSQDTADCYLKDAANFWVITAKEGNPIAQRELAGLYLSRPDLLPRTTMPLSLGRDCFRSDGLRRSDTDLCLALHWMKLSASNGDELAKKRLKEHEQRGVFTNRFE